MTERRGGEKAVRGREEGGDMGWREGEAGGNRKRRGKLVPFGHFLVI